MLTYCVFSFSTNSFLWKFITFLTWLKQTSCWPFMDCSWKVIKKRYRNLLLFALVDWPGYHERFSPANSRTVACELSLRHSPDIPPWIPALWKFCWGKWVIKSYWQRGTATQLPDEAPSFAVDGASSLQTETIMKNNIHIMLYAYRHLHVIVRFSNLR